MTGQLGDALTAYSARRLRKEGLINDYEQLGEWDRTRSPGPGHAMGVFVHEYDDSGCICYPVWVKEDAE